MRPGKIVSIGWNYRSHLHETDAVLPSEPLVFLKPSSCLIGDGDDIIIPEGVENVQHEVELALVFGTTGRNIPESDALRYVSHVAVFNDVTARDMQTEARGKGNPWSLSKGMDTFGPMSEPVPVDEAGNIGDLEMRLTVNGELRQSGRTSEMVFPIPRLISFVSRYMTLEEGDVMITGTPEGIGELRHGDVVCASINGVGSVTNRVV